MRFKSIFKHSFFNYLSGNLFYQFSFVLSELYILSIISPIDMGVFQLGLLIFSYISFSKLGILNAFNIEYPESLALNKDKKVNDILTTTKTHILISSGFHFIFFLIYGLINSLNFVFFLLFGAYLFMESFVSFEEAKKRATLNFNFISKVKVISSIVVIITVIIPHYIGLNGIVIRLIILQIFILLLYNKFKFNFKTPIKLNFIEWKNLFKTGWKLWIWSYLKSFSKTFPKLLIASFMSIEFLGLYSPVQWVFSSFVLITSSVSSYLYPKLIYINNTKTSDNVSKYSIKVTLLTFICLIPLSIIAFHLIPYFFNQILPQYSSSINATQIVIFAGLFEVITLNASSWISQKKWKTVFTYLFWIVFLRFFAMLFVYLFFELSLENICYGLLIGSILVSLVTFFMNYLENKKSKSE